MSDGQGAVHRSSTEAPAVGSIEALKVEIVLPTGMRRIDTAGVPIEAVRSMLRKLTGADLVTRTEFGLYGPYLEWLRKGRKTTTIRFRHGAVELPSGPVLDVFQTYDFGSRNDLPSVGRLQIYGVRYQRYGQLTRNDALQDGFLHHRDMRRALRKIYPGLRDEDWVTVYTISMVDPDQ